MTREYDDSDSDSDVSINDDNEQNSQNVSQGNSQNDTQNYSQDITLSNPSYDFLGNENIIDNAITFIKKYLEDIVVFSYLPENFSKGETDEDGHRITIDIKFEYYNHTKTQVVLSKKKTDKNEVIINEDHTNYFVIELERIRDKLSNYFVTINYVKENNCSFIVAK